MLKYLNKLAMEIVPSVVATILGAYIVNHYINAKPATPAATVAAVAPTAANSKAEGAKSDGTKADGTKADGAKADGKPAETSAELSNVAAPGIKAKGIADKSTTDKASGEKSSDGKPAETVSVPAETPRHAPAREKLIARSTPTETPAPEDHRDAADLARAAIERLRASESGKATEKGAADKAAEKSSAPADTPRILTAVPPVSPVRPLPPPISVSTPPAEGPAVVIGPPPGSPAYTGAVQTDARPTPPADIPGPPPLSPLDLRADTESTKDRMHNVAEDMLSAAKSVFHAVIPK